MSNYIKSTDFAAKDALPSGDAAKVIKGAEFEDEFDAIATAVNSKADTASPTFTGTVTLPTAVVTTLSLGGTTITSTGAELNLLDGVTASTAELNLLDGVTATTAELNLLDGVTATTSELNRLDVSAGVATPLKAMVFGGNNRIRFNDNYTVTFGDSNNLHIFHDGTDSHIKEYNNPLNVDGIGVNIQHNGSTKLATSTTGVAITGEMSATTINIGGTAVTATAAELNLVDGLTAIPNYATGTFTPTIFSGTTQQSAATATGRYTTVGDMVTVFITLVNIDATGSTGTDIVVIKDLPFNCAIESNGYYVGSAFCANIVNPSGTDNGHFIPVINSNSSTDSMTLFATVNNSGQPETMVWSDINDDTADIHITLTYKKA